MIRFTMPEAFLPLDEKKTLLKKQFEAFLDSDALMDLLDLIGTDKKGLSGTYGKRQKPSGGIMEAQEIGKMPELEKYRYEMYPLFRELGFIDTNAPMKSDHTRVLIYGGALGICFKRTHFSVRFLTDKTKSLDALTCYRPINPIERTNSSSGSMAETEFGALTEAFENVYGLDENDRIDSFSGDRNLNSISCLRTYDQKSDGCAYRLFAAPSSEPELRRANTGDCFAYYIKQTCPNENDSLLAITSNRFCNSQFVQTAYQLITNDCNADFDIIGCHTDDEIATVEDYDPLQYLQDLISLLDWIDRFSKL